MEEPTQEEIELKVLERGVQMMVSDKFAKVIANSERYPRYMAKVISLLGIAMGKKLDSIEYPANWQRFLQRKDCPQYMKEIRKVNVNVYYPELPLPKEPYWLTFDTVARD